MKIKDIDIITVRLNGDIVGRIALTPEGIAAFEYDKNWIANGFSISPFFLPLKPGVFTAKQHPFYGNFGVFADSFKCTIFTNDNTGGQTGGAKGGAMGGAILTERQLEIVELMKNNSSISYREIAKTLNINNSAVLKHIKSLKLSGIIERIGGTRGHWQVTKPM